MLVSHIITLVAMILLLLGMQMTFTRCIRLLEEMKLNLNFKFKVLGVISIDMSVDSF